MKQRIKCYKILRRSLQVLSLILMPGLFASTFTAVKVLFTAAYQGIFTWEHIESSVWLLCSTIPATFICGRFFCGFFCSFGAMQDFLSYLGTKLKIKKIEVPQKVDAILKYLKYVILLSFPLLIWNGVITSTMPESANPWNTFGKIVSIRSVDALPEVVSDIMTVGGLLLLLIMFCSIFIERFFCRYLCPMGAIYGILAKLRSFHFVKRDNRHTSIRRKIPVWVSLLITGAMIVGGQIAVRTVAEKRSNGTYVISAQKTPGKYTDGTYEGEAIGYRGTTKVSVTVEQGYMTAIDIESYEDDKTYFEQAESVIARILEAQDTEVDATSGATISSNGIKHAVKTALKDADAASAQGKFEDGIYRGTAFAFRGDVELEVTVEHGNITDIRIISYYDNEEYFNQAENIVIDEIIEQQDLSVDAVSGATYSSNGIIKAVANALGIPEYELTLQEGKELSSLHNNHGHVVKKYR